MRRSTILIISLSITTFIGCKSTSSGRAARERLDAVENTEQLPDCDDVTVGRAYWVRSLNAQVLCAEGGTWKPRQVDTDSNEAGFGPRSINE